MSNYHLHKRYALATLLIIVVGAIAHPSMVKAQRPTQYPTVQGFSLGMTHRQIQTAARKFGWYRITTDRSITKSDAYQFKRRSGKSVYVTAVVSVSSFGRLDTVTIYGRSATTQDSTQLRADIATMISDAQQLMGKPKDRSLPFTMEELLTWEKGHIVTCAMWRCLPLGNCVVDVFLESTGQAQPYIRMMIV